MSLQARILNFASRGRILRVYGRSILRYSTPKKFLNALRVERALRTRRADTSAKPYLLFLEPLYYCNLSCPLCHREAFPTARKEDPVKKLPIRIYEKVLEELGDYLYQCQIFGLGEPMLDWPLTRRIIDMAHDRRIFTLVSTNCTLITAEMADDIIACNLDYLICAIDGISEESYQSYRRGGTFARAMEGLRHLVRARAARGHGPTIEWQFLVSRYNHHEMDAARKLADQLGVYLRFSPLEGAGPQSDSQEYWLPPASSGYQKSVLPAAPQQDIPCYWLWRGVVLNSNGHLGRCALYQNTTDLGSVEHQSVMSLYNGPDSQRSRQLFAPGEVPAGPFPSPCNNCACYRRHHGGPYLDETEIYGDRYTRAPLIPVTIKRPKSAGPA